MTTTATYLPEGPLPMSRIATLPTANFTSFHPLPKAPTPFAGTVPANTAELGYKGRGMTGR